jgi:ABC-type sugar transport system ATPase subunit
VLGGVVRRDTGDMLAGGEAVDFHSPHDARDAGIAVIYQEPTLFPDLSIAENVVMGYHPHGPVTIVGCTQTAEGELKLLGEGESIPGDTFRIGNTNSRLRFGLPPAEFFERWCEEGPTHHVALGVGLVAEEVRKVASMFGLECAEVG